jgi:hypothetical protein
MKKSPTSQELEERVRRLDKNEPLGYRRLEEALRKRTKELNCLFTILEIINRPGIALDERLQQIADALPSGWQYSDLASARLVFKGKTYLSQGFSGGPFGQGADIVVQGKRAGFIEVFYGEERSSHDEGPFLKTERDLINAIARRVSRFIERRRAEEEREIALERLQEALGKILSGFLPICAKCKKIRDDNGKWVEIEAYIRDRMEVQFSHSICPVCAKGLYTEPNTEQVDGVRGLL